MSLLHIHQLFPYLQTVPQLKNFPPRLSTCSLDAALTSVAETIAPNLLAVAIACNPATPAPITKTLAASTVPAAPSSSEQLFSNSAIQSTTALYPARDLIVKIKHPLIEL